MKVRNRKIGEQESVWRIGRMNSEFAQKRRFRVWNCPKGQKLPLIRANFRPNGQMIVNTAWFEKDALEANIWITQIIKITQIIV